MQKETVWKIRAVSFIFVFLGAFSFLIRRNWIKLHPNQAALSFGIILAVGGLLVLEGFAWWLNNEGVILESRIIEGAPSTTPFVQKDRLLGTKPIPNIVVSSSLVKSKQKIYEADYSFDSYGRRITPVEVADRRRKFAQFFGCSMMFGTGVNDQETLPYYFGQLAQDYRPYNYGFQGYGPQMMLAKLEDPSIKQEVGEKTGILVYLFIDDHIDRAATRHYPLGGTPYYSLNSGQLIREGTLSLKKEMLGKFFLFLNQSQFLKALRLTFPKISETDIRLTVEIIKKSRDSFHRQFGSSDFYVILYPGQKYNEVMKKYFDRGGIKYFDYSTLFEISDAEFTIEGDGHSTPRANSLLANRLISDLEIESTVT